MAEEDGEDGDGEAGGKKERGLFWGCGRLR